MATQMPMPKLGLTMEEGTIIAWRKEEGDAVKKGEILLDIQTDKVEYEVESPDNGILLKKMFDADSVVPCGENIAVIGAKGEKVDSATPAPKAEKAKEPLKEEVSTSNETKAAAPVGNRIFASPAAKRLAKELGVDYTTVQGTGPNGRIILKDIEGASKQPVPVTAQAVSYGTEPVSPMRKVVAQRMSESWSNVARITLQSEVDLTNLLAVRNASSQAWETDLGVKISINDLILFYTARAIQKCPAVNVKFLGDSVERAEQINIGVAVALEDGLMVPVLKNANQKSIDAISSETNALATAARNGTLDPGSLQGGTFTVTNLGAYGVDHFTAIINYPESAILSVGAARERAVVKNGEVVAGTTAYFGINCDHRIIDGAPAAEFLKTLKEMLEHPKVMPA